MPAQRPSDDVVAHSQVGRGHVYPSSDLHFAHGLTLDQYQKVLKKDPISFLFKATVVEELNLFVSDY